MSLPSGVRVYYGNDAHRMDNDIEKLIERVLPDESTRSFNLERLDGSEVSASQVLVVARSLPFMAKRRVVVVREPAFFTAGARKKGLITAEEEEDLLSFCKSPNPDALLIFRYTTEDAPGAYLKKIINATDAVHCVQPKGREVAPWLRAEAKKMGKSFTPQAMAMMEELAPQDGTLLLSNELEKLTLYLKESEDILITEEAVAAIVTPTPSRTIFNLLDAVVAGKTRDALAAYRDCLYLGTKSPQVLRQLVDTAKRLLVVQSMLADGQGLGTIKDTLKRHEFYVKKLMGQAQRVPTEAVSEMFTYLVACDVKSKSTAGLEMDAFVEEIIINCCAKMAIRARKIR